MADSKKGSNRFNREIRTMNRIAKLLDELDQATRARVGAWVASYAVSPPQPTLFDQAKRAQDITL